MMVTTAGGNVIGERWGSDDPQVLAMHGWGRTHRDWQPSLGSLPCISVDLPGFGASPPPESVRGSAWYADQVAGFLDKFGPMVLVGHSFGGRVAVHLGAKHPDLVRGIVLTGAPLVNTKPPVKPSLQVRIAKKLSAKGVLPHSVMDKLKDKHGSPDYRAAQGVMREVLVTVLHEDYSAQLSQLECPVRCVWGEHDTAAPVEVAHAIAQRADDVTVEVVEGEAHPLSGKLGDRVRASVDVLLENTDEG